MMNMDARTVAIAQNARVRARSGPEPASGKSGTPADAFELIFRRLKDQAAPADPVSADSRAPAIHDPPRDHSTPTAPKVGGQAHPPTRGPASPNAPGSEVAGHSIAARDPGVSGEPLSSGPVAQAREIVANAAARLAGIDSAGETLGAQSSSVATMTVPFAREAALKSIIAATEQSAPEAATSVFVDKSGAVKSGVLAQSGVEPIVFTGEAAAQGDKMTRFIPATPQNHRVPASEAVVERNVEPNAGTPQIALDTPARFIETPVTRGGAVLDGAETAGGAVVDTLTEATGGGTLSHLTSPPAIEQSAAQPTGQPAGQGAGVERAQLIDQIVQGVKMAQRNESTEVVVHLKPEFLGKLSIRVVADEHGMRIEIRAENQVVRQIMQDNQADLQQRLSEKGLAFDQFSVFAEAGSHSERETARSFDAPDNGSKIGVQAAREADLVETMSSASSGGIDYFA